MMRDVYQTFVKRHTYSVFLFAFVACFAFIMILIFNYTWPLKCLSDCQNPAVQAFYRRTWQDFIYAVLLDLGTSMICAFSAAFMWRRKNRQTYNKNSPYISAVTIWFFSTLFFTIMVTVLSFERPLQLLPLSIPIGFVISLFLALPVVIVVAGIHSAYCLSQLEKINYPSSAPQ